MRRWVSATGMSAHGVTRPWLVRNRKYGGWHDYDRPLQYEVARHPDMGCVRPAAGQAPRRGFGAGRWCTPGSSAHRDEQRRRNRQACNERLVREGKAHAVLVFDGDLAVAWCQFGAVPGRARRQLAEIDQIVPPGGAVVTVVSAGFRLRAPCPTDGDDSLACVADGTATAFKA